MSLVIPIVEVFVVECYEVVLDVGICYGVVEDGVVSSISWWCCDGKEKVMQVKKARVLYQPTVSSHHGAAKQGLLPGRACCPARAAS